VGSTVRALRAANIWALLVVAVIVLGLIVWQQRDSNTSTTPTSESSSTGSAGDDDHESRIQVATDRLERAWNERNRDAFVSAAGTTPAAQSWGAQTYDSLNELGVKRIDFEPRTGDFSDMQVVPDGTSNVPVEVSWVPGAASGLPRQPTEPVRVLFDVRMIENGLAIESTQPLNEPMPIWLEGALNVLRRDNATIVRINGGSEEPKLQTMLVRAGAAVREVYGKPRRDLFVVLPSDGGESADITGMDESRIDQLAATTSSLDGSSSSKAPIAVVLNPDVFTSMNPRAAQIVLTHEATHEVTGAVSAVAPLWVTEGYADYVAMIDDALSPTRSASRMLARVRKNGPPRHLPSDEVFSASGPRLGATYEGAWMVFRMLGEVYDDATIGRFYRQVLHGRAVDVAAQKVFGVGIDEITADWRRYLRDWAAAPR